MAEKKCHLRDDIPGVILRVKYSGLCGTDVRIVRRERGHDTFILGHEGCTLVEMHNSDKIKEKPGDRIFINPNPRALTKHKGHIGHDRPGMFQKYLYLSEEDYFSHFGCLIPNEISDLESVFLESWSCCMHTIGKLSLDVWLNSKIAIFGAGHMAASHILALNNIGVNSDNIFLFNRSPLRLNYIAHKLCLNKCNTFVIGNILANFKSFFDIIILTNSEAYTYINEAIVYVNNYGKILIFGGISTNYKITGISQTFDMLDIRLNEKNLLCKMHDKDVALIGTRSFVEQDVRLAIERCRSNKTNFLSLLGDVLSTDDFIYTLNSIKRSKTTEYLGKQICVF